MFEFFGIMFDTVSVFFVFCVKQFYLHGVSFLMILDSESVDSQSGGQFKNSSFT